MQVPLIAVVFVVIWSTGWIVGKYAVPHADPLAFLALRYLGALALFVPAAFLLGARWPATLRLWGHALLSGVMLHGVYLGGVWWAIAHGVPAGISALIAALQPLFTALAAGPLVGERLSAARWGGVGLGFAGVALVVAPKLAGGLPLGLPLAVNVLAMVAVTAATLHQKRALAGMDLKALAPAQCVGALIVTVPAIALFGEFRFDATPEAFGALAWSVLVLSIAAVTLMLVMIERGEVSRVAALIYLVPPVAALQAWAMFGETLSVIQIAGMALAAVGVVLANGTGRPASAEGCIAANPPDDEDAAETFRRPA
ncbi:DMT family transporter [Chenggangzhangella methanolivorans]|uniref:DMT family transporter n=1 Tax=Chenggangzhangella methanolivorans TaxID=1437009 RepID=A0A9E6R7W6_9HYPH|nr:DMT family transporter [Chenggangzhangella methanolivorans]QZN98478.1 DMT family transporter [Chenggangzhangella methanolivorans]